MPKKEIVKEVPKVAAKVVVKEVPKAPVKPIEVKKPVVKKV